MKIFTVSDGVDGRVGGNGVDISAYFPGEPLYQPDDATSVAPVREDGDRRGNAPAAEARVNHCQRDVDVVFRLSHSHRPVRRVSGCLHGSSRGRVSIIRGLMLK